VRRARKLVARIAGSGYVAETTGDGRVRIVANGPPGTDDARAEGLATLEAHYLGHGRVRVSTPQRSWLAYVVEDSDTRWVWLEGRVFRVDVEQAAGGRRRARAAGPDALSAPMPATVIRIVARPGTRVRRGDPLVILEAMKMELPLRAPHDAVVTAVNCAEGDLVQPGIALLSLEGTGD
jgi:biotin carboxyl carrier protein